MLERCISENCSQFKMGLHGLSHEKENTTQSPQHFETICTSCLWNRESASSIACLCTSVFMELLRYISPRCVPGIRRCFDSEHYQLRSAVRGELVVPPATKLTLGVPVLDMLVHLYGTRSRETFVTFPFLLASFNLNSKRSCTAKFIMFDCAFVVTSY